MVVGLQTPRARIHGIECVEQQTFVELAALGVRRPVIVRSVTPRDTASSIQTTRPAKNKLCDERLKNISSPLARVIALTASVLVTIADSDSGTSADVVCSDDSEVN